MGNIAFIDGQNLFKGTNSADIPWVIDLARFRIYLAKKYNVSIAYYYLGCLLEGNESLYEEIQLAGFVLKFREHNTEMLSHKKGNVDTDIVFQIMKRMYKKEIDNFIVLVSGDGDYKQLVDFLIEENKMGKILFPNHKRSSSLYKTIELRYWADLGAIGVKNKIEKRKGLLR